MEGTPGTGSRRGRLAIACAVGGAILICTGTAASRTDRATAALPTWESSYAWASGDGYAGWHAATSSTADYGLEPALGGRPGLWLWPAGGQHVYTPGDYAEWTLTAPGTTRLQAVRLSFAYRNKLLAHHCIDIGLRDGDGATLVHEEHCKPVEPPDSQAKTDVTLADPAASPTAKVIYLRIQVDCGGASTCSKTIPSLDPLKNGAFVRMLAADLTLVDDDKPMVTPSNTFYDDLGYVSGSEAYPLTVSSDDPGAGIVRSAVDGLTAEKTLISSPAPCDLHHHTPELDARICPEAYSFDTQVDTSALPEGANLFVARSLDPAGNVGQSPQWEIDVDRTPPAAPTDVAVDNYDAASSTATIAWTPAGDPDLADGTPGSGESSYQLQLRVGDGAWSDWTESPDASVDVPGVAVGAAIGVRVRALDSVGNVGDATEALLTVTGTESDPADDYGVSEPSTIAHAPAVPDDPPDPGAEGPQIARAVTVTKPCDQNAAHVTWRPCTVVDGEDTVGGVPKASEMVVLRNGDGRWGIFNVCADNQQTGEDRLSVGPGYIAYMRDSHGRMITNDYWAHRFFNFGAINGGFGAFELQYARGPAGQTPAGDDVLTKGVVETQVDRNPALISSRMCTNNPTSNGAGVSLVLPAVGYPRTGQLPNGTAYVAYVVDVFLRDPAGDTGWKIPGLSGKSTAIGAAIADSMIRLHYRYEFFAHGVKTWMSVTTHAVTNTDGVPFVKEPKYVVALRENPFPGSTLPDGTAPKFTRMSVWQDGAGTSRPLYWTGVMQGEPEHPAGGGNPNLNTEKDSHLHRSRVRWDYGSEITATQKNVDPSGDAGCTDDLCFNAVMRSIPATASGGVSIRRPAHDWAFSNLGLDAWAMRAGKEAWTRAYPVDTLADWAGTPAKGDVDATGHGTRPHPWACGLGFPVSQYTDAQIAEKTRALHTNVSNNREWELAGWKAKAGGEANPLPYQGSATLFHGWEGGQGPYDCEPLLVTFAKQAVSDNGKQAWISSWGTFASYSFGTFREDGRDLLGVRAD